MPKISAPSIAEHVRIQEEAILGAAARLFAEQGFAATDLADIAEQVGLARSSLYRYFPDKDHILLRWFEREMAPVLAHAEAIATGPGTAEERLLAWLDYQLELVCDPTHELAPKIMAEIGAVSPEVRAAMSAGHVDLYRTLGSLVTEVLRGDESAMPDNDAAPNAARDPRLVTEVIGGIVEAVARSVTHGTDPAVAGVELRRSALAVLRPA